MSKKHPHGADIPKIYAEEQEAMLTPKPRVVYEETPPAPAYGVILCITDPRGENVLRGLILSRGIIIYNLANQGQVDAANSLVGEFPDRYMHGTVADAERVYGLGQQLDSAIQRAMNDTSIAPMRYLS